MTHPARTLMGISLLIISCNIAHAVTYYSIRSQSENADREYVGWQQYIQIPDQDKLYGSANLTFEYSRSFNPSSIAECLFQNSLAGKTKCGNVINVSGSTVPYRGERDWLADYFALPTDFQSTLQFDPFIDNFILDFNFFFGFDEFVPGLFFRVHVPVVHTRWSLRFKETVLNPGSNEGLYPTGYFTQSQVPIKEMLPDVTAYMNGQQPKLNNNIKYNELTCSRIATDCNQPQKETGVAEIQAVLGYSLTNSDRYHCALGLRVAAPTGTRPNGTYLFKPIVGNGKHWELGGQLTGSYTLWDSMSNYSHASIQTVANVTHLFNAHQTRCFDLCGEPNSRYMLAERMSAPVINNLQGDGIPALAQFQGEYAPVANVTMSNIAVSVGVQADILFAFSYISNNLSFDLGYDLWVRSCEKIKIREGCAPDSLNGRTWALKGDAFVFGFDQGHPIALSATEQAATIHEGTNGILNGLNSNVDNAQLATGDYTGMNANNPLYSMADGYPYVQTSTSIQPVFISENNLDLTGTKGLSNKIFTHLSYSWLECEDWTPYFGFGGEVEFGSNSSADCGPIVPIIQEPCTKCCDDCETCSLSQWGVWVKGGFTFN